MATDSKSLTASADSAAVLEKVVVGGDLSKLSAAERITYYGEVCRSLGLNPLTRPFEYVNLSGKLVLYARKDATEQLRKLHGVSIDKPDVTYADDLIIVAVSARDAAGRTDSDLGVVSIGNLKGEARANAVLKAVTKAKRRVTLSICGLGMLDETEVETIPGARPIVTEQAADDDVAEKRRLAVQIQDLCATQRRAVPASGKEWGDLAVSLGMPAIKSKSEMTVEWLEQVKTRLDAHQSADDSAIGKSTAYAKWESVIAKAAARHEVIAALEDAALELDADESAQLDKLGEARFESLPEEEAVPA